MARITQLATREPHRFENAGHGFLHAQTAQNGANIKATEQAWPMTVAFIKKHTGQMSLVGGMGRVG